MITVKANARSASYDSDDLITSGSAGIPCEFVLSSDFNGLSPIAVFEGSGTARDVALMGNTCVVPHEVLTTAGGYLRIGIYASNSAGTIVIPTVWAGSKMILQGTEPSEVDPSEPTPSWVAQVQEAAAVALANSEEAIEIAGGADAAAEEARQSASAAATSATAAEQSESAASGSATSASGSASAAAQSATAAAGSASGAASSASAAEGSATAAAGSAAAAAASEAAARAVQESIPEDYADLSADVVDLKSQTSKVIDSDATGIDIDLTDGQGHVLARFANGGVQTKAFDSAKTSAVVPTDATDSDIDFVDGQGHVVMRLADGHIQTKGFDSKSAVESIQALTDAIGSDYVVPDYWITYLQEKEAAINALNMALDSGESFIFFTDYHQGSNNKNSAPLMRHIVDHTSITDVVYGGDTTDGGTLPTPQAAEAVVRAFSNLFKPLKIKPVRGNHDCEPSAYQTINQIPDAAWYDMMIRPIENDVVSSNEQYFYYDIPNQKIRHMVMDSGGMNDALTETQLTWMKARLTELETGWTAVIFQHMVVESTPAEQTVHMITRGTKTLNAIGDVYSQLNCTIAALVCGHLHVDTIVDTPYNFKIIGTTCDAGGANSQGYDWNNPTRPAGTTNEQAFDVYSIDTTNRTINITRIGAGSNRSVQY